MKKILQITLLLLLCACSVNEINENTLETPTETDGQKALRILEKIGFNTHNATMDNESITIEGDISMNINFILESHEKQKKLPEGKQALSRKHTFYGGKVSNEYNNRVKFSMAPNMQGQWLTALNIAIARYNKVNECRVHMSYSTGSSHSHISYKSLSGNTLAEGEFPKKTIHSNLRTYRKPGTYIHIDPVKTRNTSLADKVHLLMHEMGHNMGFDHVFDNANHQAQYTFNGTQIQGTILYDRFSAMNADGYDSQGIFTINDKKALKITYQGPFVNDFNQTISGPQVSFTGMPVNYSTSASSPGNTFFWQVNYVGSSSWINIPNGRNSSVSFNIGSQAAPNGLNTMKVQCTVTKPNGDESRKSFSTRVEGIPTDGTQPR